MQQGGSREHVVWYTETRDVFLISVHLNVIIRTHGLRPVKEPASSGAEINNHLPIESDPRERR